MAKYHIKDNGEPGKCEAQEGRCPKGSDNPHFTTQEAAREYFEKISEGSLFPESQHKVSFVAPIPETFYHVTTRANYEKIKEEGLTPKVGERSAELGEDAYRVYMFDSKMSMEDAFGGWLGDAMEDEDDLVLISVNSSKVKNFEPTYDEEEGSSEWSTLSPIAAKDITLEPDQLN